jgi:hypothetical protein
MNENFHGSDDYSRKLLILEKKMSDLKQKTSVMPGMNNPVTEQMAIISSKVLSEF